MEVSGQLNAPVALPRCKSTRYQNRSIVGSVKFDKAHLTKTAPTNHYFFNNINFINLMFR